MAGEQTRSMPGRPGLNGVRHHTVYRLPEAQLRALRQIADDVMINAAADITRAEGYAPPLPANEAAFGDLRFEAAQEPGQHTWRKRNRYVARGKEHTRSALYGRLCGGGHAFP